MQKTNLRCDHLRTICLEASHKTLPEPVARLAKTGSSLGPSSIQYSGRALGCGVCVTHPSPRGNGLGRVGVTPVLSKPIRCPLTGHFELSMGPGV